MRASVGTARGVRSPGAIARRIAAACVLVLAFLPHALQAGVPGAMGNPPTVARQGRNAPGEGTDSLTPAVRTDGLRTRMARWRACGRLERLRPAPETCWSRLRRLLLPREITMVYDLRALIAAQRPLAPRTRDTDLRRLDAMYAHAVYLAEGDATMALFALAFATLPYHTFPARIPLLGWTVTVPVSTESPRSYRRRMANLPGILLPDSPPQLDRDKLPHFFGSAWLQCALRDEALALSAGELIEYGEELFKLEGFRDDRDLFVNLLGVRFAGALLRQRDVLPSVFFRNAQ